MTAHRLLWVFLLAASGGAPASVDREVYAMGTRLSLHFEGDAGQASEQAVREVERIEAACSTWRHDSDWSRLNHSGGRPFPLAPEWMDLLWEAEAWNGKTGGAFDPVLGELIRAWGLRQGGRTPAPDELRAARGASGSSHLELDRKHGTARLTAGAAVEEGGFVKGYALDRARAVAQAAGVRSGWMNFGGQLIAWGTPLPAEVAAPDVRTQPAVRLTLSNGSLSSSGTSEHGRHILDPATGQRCPAWGSATTVMPSGLDADVLSTALYVMGPRRALAWAEGHQVAALLQPNDGPPEMSSRFHALAAVPLTAASESR